MLCYALQNAPELVTRNVIHITDSNIIQLQLSQNIKKSKAHETVGAQIITLNVNWAYSKQKAVRVKSKCNPSHMHVCVFLKASMPVSYMKKLYTCLSSAVKNWLRSRCFLNAISPWILELLASNLQRTLYKTQQNKNTVCK